MHRTRIFWWLPVFWFVTAFLYHHCVHAHLLDDFIAGIYSYQLQGPSGFWNSFGVPSLYYGHNFFFYGFYLLFGLNDYAWHFLFVSLHAVNAWLFYYCAVEILKRFNLAHAEQAVVVAALFFLCGQHQSENVVWAATLHYQVSMLLMWLGCMAVMKRMSSIVLVVLFSVSVLTLEASLVFPGIWAVLHRLLYKNSLYTLRQVVLPLLVCIALYFVATFLLRGVWIPHYGNEHLSNWSLLKVIGTYLKYLAKIFGFVHFLDYPIREKVYNLFDRADVVAAVVTMFGVVIYGVYKTPGRKRLAFALLVLVLLSFIALLPVLNMYFMYLNQIENDRLSFLATPFLYLSLSLILTQLTAWIWVPATAILLLAMKHFLGLYCWYWIQASEMQQQTLHTFAYASAQKIYTLNLPQNYGGAYIYRKPWRFEAALLVMNGQDVKGRIHNVAGQNHFQNGDGVVVEQLDSSTLKVTNVGWGWFWRDMQGAADYETDDFIFDLCDGYYLVHFRHPPRLPEAVVIYQQNGTWKKWIWQ